jgi:hypothetical protein
VTVRGQRFYVSVMLLQMLPACTGTFDFEVRVGIFDEATRIVVDGEPREATTFDGTWEWVVVSDSFANYQEGRAASGFHIQVLQNNEAVYERQLRPGLCAANTGETDWTEETVFISTSPQYLGVGRYECRAPGRHISTVVGRLTPDNTQGLPLRLPASSAASAALAFARFSGDFWPSGSDSHSATACSR